MSTPLPLLYRELASWFHLLSPPDEYVVESGVYRDLMTAVLPSGSRRLLELGALRSAIATALAHCRPGGVAVFAPDWVKESFHPFTSHGGADGEGRALRYLEWDWDPDPDDGTYFVDFVYMLRERGEELRVVHERHVEGLFPRATWLRLFDEVGFRARSAPRPDTGEEIGELFVAERP